MYRTIFTAACMFFCVLVNAQELNDIVVDEPANEVQEQVQTGPRHSISLGMGRTSIISKVMTYRGEYSHRGGTEYSVEYGCVFRKGFGFGLSFTHNKTSYPSDKMK